jgi:hypothetical protein
MFSLCALLLSENALFRSYTWTCTRHNLFRSIFTLELAQDITCLEITSELCDGNFTNLGGSGRPVLM